MNLDQIISILIVPIIFIWIGIKIYKHEKDHLDPMIEKVKGWFSGNKQDSNGDDTYIDTGNYNIEYQGAEY